MFTEVCADDCVLVNVLVNACLSHDALPFLYNVFFYTHNGRLVRFSLYILLFLFRLFIFHYLCWIMHIGV